MAALSVAALLDLVRELPLLSPAQAAELSRLAAEQPDVAALLREMHRRQWLSTYQIKSIVAGEGPSLVVGPYLLLDLLGQGAMGRVYLARHTRTGQRVALKVIPPEILQYKRAALRFQREVFAATQLTHPHIVRAYDAGQSGQSCYLAMEYIEGIDLSQLVKQNGPLAPPLACELIRQAALGLQHAHDKDLIHRDIKPSNLMLLRQANLPPTIKMLDFGLARIIGEADDESRLTQVGKMLGTVDYISPEQVVNARTADARSDVFSLGATLFYVLTGTPPYGGKDVLEKISARVMGDAARLGEYRKDVPAGLEAIVAKMMAREPAHRYAAAEEVARALAPFCLRATVKTPAAAPSTPEPRQSAPVAAVVKVELVPLAPAAVAAPAAVESAASATVAVSPRTVQRPRAKTQRVTVSKRLRRPNRSHAIRVLIVLALVLLFVGGSGLVLWRVLRDEAPANHRIDQPAASEKDKEHGKEKHKSLPDQPLAPQLVELLRGLKSPRRETRLLTAGALAKMKPEQVHPALPALVEHIPAEKDRRVQNSLLRTLSAVARPGDDKAIALFEKLLADNDLDTSRLAGQALEKLAPQRAAAKVKKLGEQLVSGDEMQRRQASVSLLGFGASLAEIVLPLTRALLDKGPGTRRRAAQLLARLGARAAPAAANLANMVEKDKLTINRAAAAEALESMRFPANEKALPALVRVIQRDTDPRVRQRCVWALGTAPDLEKIAAIGPLEGLLRTDHPPFLPTRYSAAIVLANNRKDRSSEQVVASLLRLMQDKSMTVLDVLGTGGDNRDGRFLAVLPLSNTLNPMRREMIRRKLQEAARDDDPEMRKHAEGALKRLK